MTHKNLKCLLLRNFCFHCCTGRKQQYMRTDYVKENSFPSGKWFLIPNSLQKNNRGIKRKIVVNSVSAEILTIPNFITLIYIPWVKFVMCTLVSRDSVSFSQYIKRHVYLGNQGTRDIINQIQFFFFYIIKKRMIL